MQSTSMKEGASQSTMVPQQLFPTTATLKKTYGLGSGWVKSFRLGDDKFDLEPLLIEDGTLSGNEGKVQDYGAVTRGIGKGWLHKAVEWWHKLAAMLLLALVLASISRKAIMMDKSSSLFSTKCSDMQFPQCEGAIMFYLSKGAADRCAAFERVKAEGDFFQFPSSPKKQTLCTTEGCCGCPGQCSKCPPVLPECISWRLDGEWKVAFGDGVEAKYTFDADGHVEVELPRTEVPRSWKFVSHAMAPGGNDLAEPQWMTPEEARALCAKTPTCRCATWDTRNVQGKSGCWKPDVQRLPLDMEGEPATPVKGPEECNERCKKVHGCLRWTFLADGSCHLSAAGTQEVAAAGAVSGSPLCLDSCACSAASVVKVGECQHMLDLGFGHQSAEECLVDAFGHPGCGDEVMFSPSYNQNWGCRCCAAGSAFRPNPNWEVERCSEPIKCMPGMNSSTDTTHLRYFVYLKSSDFVFRSAASGWSSVVEEARPELSQGVALAGPLTPVGSPSATSAFTFDLHKASPSLFPQGALELLNFTGGELTVQRHLGAGSLGGVGIRVK